MTLTKAIEILNQDIDDPGSVAIDDVNEAELLGIEALKLQQEEKDRISPDLYEPLPGETEE